MSIGAFGENFPYTNFHELNTDWLIKVAKEFLDKYSDIEQETSQLETLLQEWYDTHSQDIERQLQQAIIEFIATATRESNELLASWPEDYSELVTWVNNLKTGLNSEHTQPEGYLLQSTNDGQGFRWSPAGLPTEEQVEEAVTDWMNNHPEASTTVQDNSITTAKFVPNLRKALEAPPVNVLSLGFDNTGVTDITDLFNQYTQQYSLYFPAGKYLINDTVNVQKSVFGAGYTRKNNQDGTDATWFISNKSTGKLLHIVGSSIQLNKFNIFAKNEEYCIDIDNGSSNPVEINEVGIYNVGGRGIMVESPSTGIFGTRIIFIDTVTIWGSYNYKQSYGIFIDTNNGDNRLSNIEIMGTQVSLNIVGGITYGSNWHLWCGCLAREDNGTWWAGTRAIRMMWGGQVLASNVYIDTCAVAFYTRDGEQHNLPVIISINNLIWLDNDTSISGTSAKAILQYTVAGNPIYIIQNGYFRIRSAETSRADHLYDETIRTEGVTIYNAQSIRSENKNIGFAGYQVDKSIKYRKVITPNANTSTYNVIAKLFPMGSAGICSFNFGIRFDSNIYTVTVKQVGNNYTVESNAPVAIGLYYRIGEDGWLYVYRALGPSSAQYHVFVTSNYQRGLCMYDFELNCKNNPDWPVVQLTSNEGLTPVTRI